MRQEQSKALKESKTKAVTSTATKKERKTSETTAPTRQSSAKRQRMTEKEDMELSVERSLQLKPTGDVGILKVLAIINLRQ